jgi:uncharacterized protein (TIGR02301 family)
MSLRVLPLILLSLAMFLNGATASSGVEKVKKDAKPAAESPAPATEEKAAPYDERLLRMAEILGSVHYLRNLCNGRETEWRQLMSDLLAEETRNEPKRAAVFTAGFNRGYRSFAATYTKCTPQAVAAEEKYRAEGATLATEITARFGN